MNEPLLENGMAKIAAGTWLVSAEQPAACLGTSRRTGLRGFIVPDRAAVHQLTTTGEAWCAAADRPFLALLTALPDTPLNLVSRKLLVAPREARVKGMALKLIPLSFARLTPVTVLQKGWAVVATKSRVTRLALKEGETLTVRPEALVAWIGSKPTGFCPRLGLLDILLPRGPRNLAYSFHGPATVWFEGAEAERKFIRHGVRA